MSGARRATAVLGALLLGAAACTSTSETAPADAAPPDPYVLRWDAFPSPRDLRHDSQGMLQQAEAVRYELVVYSSTDGSVAYRASDIEGTEWRLPTSLSAGRTYHWTVRPWFRIAGRKRVGEWLLRPSRRGPRGQLPIPLSEFRSFQTPEAAPASRTVSGR